MIIVLGGGGQLATQLAIDAPLHDFPIRFLSRRELNISDQDAVSFALGSIRPSLVINCAGYTDVARADEEAHAAWKANTLGPQVLARACAARRLPLVHISTDYVFDGTKHGWYDESDPISPLGVYGRTKAEGEVAIRNTLNYHLILRTSWLYGEFGSNFLKTIIDRAGTLPELSVVADQYGCPTSTRQLARAILTIAPRLMNYEDVWGTYHFAGAMRTTWHEFATSIVECQSEFTGRRPIVRAISSEEYPEATRRPTNSALDSGRFQRRFGVRAEGWRDEIRAITAAVVRSRQHADVA